MALHQLALSRHVLQAYPRMNSKQANENDKVLEVRNYLMHSSNQRILQDDFDNCIEVFNEFLAKFEGKSSACYFGKREIEQLVSSRELRIENIKLSKLYEDASKIQNQAITFDIQVSGRFGLSVYELQGILKNTSTKDREGVASGKGDAATTYLCGTGGMTTGAAVGAIAGPPGMILGAAVGGLLGGIFGANK